MRRRLALLTVCVAMVTGAFAAGGAMAANTSWDGAPAYGNAWNPAGSFLNWIPPYTGLNVYCWLDASGYSSAVHGWTNRWFYVRWFAVYHWLYGYTPANFVNNQPSVGHC